MKIDWFKRIARLYLPVYQYESETMKIAYAGYSSIKKNYYVRLLQDGNNHHSFLGRRFFWQIPELIKSDNLDIVIAEISPITFKNFQKCNGYILPEWVRMRINIDRPLSEICKRSVSDFPDVTRKIRKNNLTYEILTDQKSFNSFNEKFYLPFITKRYGKEAWIEDLNIMWKSSPSPFLIAVRKGEKTVGMSIVRKSEDTFSLFRLGLLDGNDEYRRLGVIGAIYYFSILEGQKMRCQFLDVGGARPFFTDGLTKYKLGLGAEFITNVNPGNEVFLWLGVNEHSPSANEFINSNPFIYFNKDLSLVRSGK